MSVESKEYSKYLKSSKWTAKRDLILELDNYRCRICPYRYTKELSGDYTGLDVHHLTYDNIGNELESDLITLCRDCHSRITHYHKNEGLSLDQALDLIAKRYNKKASWLKDYALHRREIKLAHHKRRIRRNAINRKPKPVEIEAGCIPLRCIRIILGEKFVLSEH